MNATTRENGGLRQRDLDALARAEHADPFAVLGPHGDGHSGWHGIPNVVWVVLVMLLLAAASAWMTRRSRKAQGGAQ